MKLIRQIGFFPFCESHRDHRPVSGFSCNMGNASLNSANAINRARSVGSRGVFSLGFADERAAAWSRKYRR